MKRIEITETNRERISNIINEAQKRTTARIINMGDVYDAVKKLNSIFLNGTIHISKKALNGSVFIYDANAQSFPASYSYTPLSTQIKLEFANNKWYLSNIYRGHCAAKTKATYCRLSDNAKEALLKAYEEFTF